MQQSLEEFVADHKDTIETVLDIFQKGAELLSSTLEVVFPPVEAVASFVQLGLNCVESKELTYMKDKFQIIGDKLNEISSELERVKEELEKKEIDDEFSDVEENIQFLFKDFTDMLNAEPERRAWREKQFITDYNRSPAEQDIERLYTAVNKDGMRKESILVFVMNYMDMHRRAVQDYYAHLLKLFYLGLIVTMAFKNIKGDNIEKLKATWNERMKGIESQMKTLIDKCITEFHDQAKTDIEKLVNEKSGTDNQELATHIHDFLKDKYYWICWTVQVYEQSTSCLPFSLFKANYDDIFGNNLLPIFPKEKNPNPKIVVTFCTDPKPIDKQKIQKVIANMKKKPDATEIAKYISDGMPDHVVHIVSQNKGWAFACSFPEGYHYYERNQYVNICIHSDELGLTEQNTIEN